MTTAMRMRTANDIYIYIYKIHSFFFHQLQVLTAPLQLQTGELNIPRDMTKQLQYERKAC